MFLNAGGLMRCIIAIAACDKMSQVKSCCTRTSNAG